MSFIVLYPWMEWKLNTLRELDKISIRLIEICITFVRNSNWIQLSQV